MKMNKFIFAVIMVILFAGILSSQEVLALTISPPVMELEGASGQRIDKTIKLYNETDSEIVVYPTLANFKAAGETGQPRFLEPIEITEYSLANWIEIGKDPVQLAKGERKEIPFSINVPLEVEPGGHYGAIFFGTHPSYSDEEINVIKVAGQIGSLILLKVAGEIKEEGKLLEFKLKSNGKIYQYLPVDFMIGFENSGNIHLKPQGEILIRNIFGRISDVVPVNQVGIGGNVLPESSRRFDVLWQKNPIEKEPESFIEKLKAEKNNFAFGRYKADLNLSYGEENKKESASVIFWVMPWHLILVSGLAAAFLISLIILGIKRYNRWIIRKAKEQN